MRSFDFLLWKSCEFVLYCLQEKRQVLSEASSLGEQGTVAAHWLRSRHLGLASAPLLK